MIDSGGLFSCITYFYQTSPGLGATGGTPQTLLPRCPRGGYSRVEYTEEEFFPGSAWHEIRPKPAEVWGPPHSTPSPTMRPPVYRLG